MKEFIRLQGINISNLKNVSNGNIQFSKYSKSNGFNDKNSITGIYGQNGSGKTAVVDALNITKRMLMGYSIIEDITSYIKEGTDTLKICTSYYIEKDNKKYLINYELGISCKTENRAYLESEVLKASVNIDGAWNSLKKYFEYNYKSKNILFTPKKLYDVCVKNVDALVNLKMSCENSMTYDEENQKPNFTSFLFSRRTVDFFASSKCEPELGNILVLLRDFATKSMTVISNTHFGYINLNSSLMPFALSIRGKNKGSAGNIVIDITKSNHLTKEIFDFFEVAIKQSNLVINALIPGCTLSIFNKQIQNMEDGTEGITFELTTERAEKKIPLMYESAGIKKLISICTNLVSCFNNHSYCLIIDEFDSGVYEYLLGEILEIINDDAKGQLIFTSHNLRALEVLNSDSLVFTTVNENNRYIHPINIKNTQNKRLTYLRSIALGGQEELLYDETNEYEISKALRKAGKITNG